MFGNGLGNALRCGPYYIEVIEYRVVGFIEPLSSGVDLPGVQSDADDLISLLLYPNPQSCDVWLRRPFVSEFYKFHLLIIPD
jgi:hypothetical protein